MLFHPPPPPFFYGNYLPPLNPISIFADITTKRWYKGKEIIVLLVADQQDQRSLNESYKNKWIRNTVVGIGKDTCV